MSNRCRKDGSPYSPCDHDPRSPRLDLVNPPHAGMPEVLLDACDRARDFYRKPSLIPSLNKRLKSQPRERRSERRETHALLLQELLMHTDRKTWRIGNYGGAGQHGRAVKSYARNMLVNQRRAERGLEELVSAGMLLYSFDKKGRSVAAITDYAGRRYLGQKRIDKGDHTYEGLAAEREWSAKGLDELGILAELKAERDAHRKAARKDAEERAALSARAQRQHAADQQAEFRRRARIRQAPAPKPIPEDEAKATIQLAYSILEDSKSRGGTPIGLAEAMAEARRRRGIGPPE